MRPCQKAKAVNYYHNVFQINDYATVFQIKIFKIGGISNRFI